MKNNTPLCELKLSEAAIQTQYGKPLQCAEDIIPLLDEWKMSRKECFIAIHLNVKGISLARDLVSMGSATSSLIHPREVFAPALVNGAASIIIAHNHPSGDPEPSTEDIATTKRLAKAGKLLGVPIIDHIIFTANGKHYSFMEAGRI